MLKSSSLQLTKKDIAKKIHLKTGFPHTYTLKITDDLIDCLKNLIKLKKINIKNFGTFKIINKGERIGRNPRTKELYTITSRKSLSFYISKLMNDKINSFK